MARSKTSLQGDKTQQSAGLGSVNRCHSVATPLVPYSEQTENHGYSFHKRYILPRRLALGGRRLYRLMSFRSLGPPPAISRSPKSGATLRHRITRVAMLLAISSSAAPLRAADPKFEVQPKNAWVERFKDLTSIETIVFTYWAPKITSECSLFAREPESIFASDGTPLQAGSESCRIRMHS